MSPSMPATACVQNAPICLSDIAKQDDSARDLYLRINQLENKVEQQYNQFNRTFIALNSSIKLYGSGTIGRQQLEKDALTLKALYADLHRQYKANKAEFDEFISQVRTQSANDGCFKGTITLSKILIDKINIELNNSLNKQQQYLLAMLKKLYSLENNTLLAHYFKANLALLAKSSASELSIDRLISQLTDEIELLAMEIRQHIKVLKYVDVSQLSQLTTQKCHYYNHIYSDVSQYLNVLKSRLDTFDQSLCHMQKCVKTDPAARAVLDRLVIIKVDYKIFLYQLEQYEKFCSFQQLNPRNILQKPTKKEPESQIQANNVNQPQHMFESLVSRLRRFLNHELIDESSQRL